MAEPRIIRIELDGFDDDTFHAQVIAKEPYSDIEEQGRYRVQFHFDLDKKGSMRTPREAKRATSTC